MSEPNLTHVPGILLRTVARTIARLLFLIAGLLLASALAIAWISLLLCTYRSARTPRIQAAADTLTSAFQLAQTFKK